MQPEKQHCPQAEPAPIAPTVVETTDIPLAALVLHCGGDLCPDPPFRLIRKGERPALEFRLRVRDAQILDDYRRNAPVNIRIKDYESCRRHLLAMCNHTLKAQKH